MDLCTDYTKYRRLAGRRIGVLHCKGCQLTHEWGLLWSTESRLAICGIYGFGWTKEHFDYLARKGFLHKTAAEGGFDRYLLRERTAKRVALGGRSALLSFPGVYTFGHWIVDIPGRMELLNSLDKINEIEHFLLPRSNAWMEPFLAIYGISSDRIVQLNQESVYDVEDIVVPTILSHQIGGVVPIGFSQIIFEKLSAVCRHWSGLAEDAAEDTHPRKVTLLLHSRMTSADGREIENQQELAALIREIGGRVLDPLSISLPGLANLMRGQKLLIGQDSSALHNVIFAPSDLIVIETKRRQNLLHHSIQDALNKRIGFVRALEQHGRWYVDIGALRKLLKLLT